MSKFYRRIPEVVQAFQITAGRYWDTSEWPEWLSDAQNSGLLDITPAALYPVGTIGGLLLRTPEGGRAIAVDDWVVRSPVGELYVRTAKTFAAEYNPI